MNTIADLEIEASIAAVEKLAEELAGRDPTLVLPVTAAVAVIAKALRALDQGKRSHPPEW